jgi:hypothetical protein
MTPPEGSRGLRHVCWNGLKSCWTWMVKTKLPVLAFIVGAVIFGLASYTLFARLGAIDERERDQAAVQQALDNYRNELRTYDLQVTDRNSCIERAERSDKNYGQHEAIADAVEDIGGERAIALAQVLRAGPLLSSPPADASACPPVPIAPTPPKELTQ